MSDPSSNIIEDPFSHLHLHSFSPLTALQGRSKCSQCNASRKFFCYTCFTPVKELEGKLPEIELPVQIDIIKHPLELDGKSTAIHALVLAPKQVNLFTYPCIPEYEDSSKVLLVYPSENSRTLQKVLDDARKRNKDAKSKLEENGDSSNTPPAKRIRMESNVSLPFERVIFIDSTWSQSKKIFYDERLKDLPCVILPEKKTYFWRTQDKDDYYLATIEAIYYFLVELHTLSSDTPYRGHLDNLMYFFVYMYQMVKKNKTEYVKIKKKQKGKGKTKPAD